MLIIKHNLRQVQKALEEAGRQGVYATAVALTRTGQDVKAAEVAEIETAFDRPTPYTRKALYLKGATKDNLVARVWVKDDSAGSGTPATRYLLPEIEGGPRAIKGMEKGLSALGLMPADHYAVPSQGAQLDQYGNVKRSQIIQILSQLRVQLVAGYESRATGSARSNRSIRKQGQRYFALPEGNGPLPPGVYLRKDFAFGSAVRPVFVFVSSTDYPVRLKFWEVAEATRDERFPVHFEAEYRKAMESAK